MEMPPEAPPRFRLGPISRVRKGIETLRHGEAFAFVRQATLLARDVAVTLPEEETHADIVVLIHGFMATAGVLRPLRAHLERSLGVGTASFSHFPGAGIASVSHSLAQLVDALPRTSRVHLVGHSLGGIAARWYVQELGGAARVHQTISIASPFGGARAASLLPFAVGADLHKNSQMLARIREGAKSSGTPHLSIVAEGDTTGFAVEGAAIAGRPVRTVPGRGHNAILYDPEVMAIVARAVGAGLSLGTGS